MKVIVTSDSHGKIDILKEISIKYPDANLFIDAGDSERRTEEISPFLTVRGNCDLLIKNNYRVDTINGVSIYTTHGNTLFFNDKYLAMMATKYSCKIAIHGHTHIPKVTYVDGVHILCPGSVSRPRGGSKPSYAVITFNNEFDISIEIKEI